MNPTSLSRLLARANLRLIRFAVLVAAASLMVSGLILIRDNASRQLALVARTVGYTVEPGVVFGDREAVLEGVRSVADSPAVDRVEVIDPAGRVLARWHRGGTAVHAMLCDPLNPLLWPEAAVREVKRGGATLAVVHVHGDIGGQLRYLLIGGAISLVCLALTVIASRFVADRLGHEVIDPVENLAAELARIRTSGDLSQRLSGSTVAELDQAASEVNRLLAELQRLRERLPAHAASRRSAGEDEEGHDNA